MNMAETLWAWVTEYPDGSIGTISAVIPAVGHATLVARSEEVARAWGPIAHAHGRASGQRVWLRRYTVAEDIGREKAH